tara:strand:+ start:75460 stop:76683 length:1224 start_codon:yes stop_codon:yes gene_type:complete
MFLFMSVQAFAHGNHSENSYPGSNGGPLLRGYPWGIFANSVDFDKRVKHTKNDQELVLANRIFEMIAIFDAVSFPIHLEHQGYNPFGDGQSNGQAHFKEWSLPHPPVIGGLKKDSNTLTLYFAPEILQGATKVHLRNPDGLIKDYPANEDGAFEVPVNVEAWGWNTPENGKTVYVKPFHWGHWFAIKFNSPYVSVDSLANAVPESLHYRSIPNSLSIDANGDVPPLLQLQSRAAEAEYSIHTTDIVHSVYPNPSDPQFVNKSSGGNWTFLLKADLWNNEHTRATFKQLYSCFAGRSFWEESVRKSVSGTSWHHVGDPGEIILNSVEGESRELVTAIGEKVEPPPGVLLAIDLGHVGYASLLKKGQAFISKQTQFHWHPVHTIEPICVEVWTPFCPPNSQNSYGFSCN